MVTPSLTSPRNTLVLPHSLTPTLSPFRVEASVRTGDCWVLTVCVTGPPRPDASQGPDARLFSTEKDLFLPGRPGRALAPTAGRPTPAPGRGTGGAGRGPSPPPQAGGGPPSALPCCPRCWLRTRVARTRGLPPKATVAAPESGTPLTRVAVRWPGAAAAGTRPLGGTNQARARGQAPLSVPRRRRGVLGAGPGRRPLSRHLPRQARPTEGGSRPPMWGVVVPVLLVALPSSGCRTPDQLERDC